MGQAAEGLGVIYEALGNAQEAEANWRIALAVYEGLGDSMKVQELEERLSRLGQFQSVG